MSKHDGLAADGFHLLRPARNNPVDVFAGQAGGMGQPTASVPPAMGYRDDARADFVGQFGEQHNGGLMCADFNLVAIGNLPLKGIFGMYQCAVAFGLLDMPVVVHPALCERRSLCPISRN